MKYQKRKHQVMFQKILISIIVSAIIIIIVLAHINSRNKSIVSDSSCLGMENANDSNTEIQEVQNLTTAIYPESLLELLERNPEAEEFVLNYPDMKDTYSDEPLNELLDQDSVPFIMQWDSRWGYYPYSGDLFGVTGCGPTCLSMVAIHKLQDASLTPIKIADYAVEEGYCVPGSGTAWDLMNSGAKGLGLDTKEIPLDENIIFNHLENGDPIICVVGPGDFTTDGHFLVFTGKKDGYIKINDPNSLERSNKLWSYEELKPQIRNLWVYL